MFFVSFFSLIYTELHPPSRLDLMQSVVFSQNAVCSFSFSIFHCSSSIFTPFSLPHLILTRRTLARLELIQVPAADRQVALVVVHAAFKALHFVGADGSLLHVCVCVALLLLLFEGCGLGFCWGGGAAAEEAADCVAD